MTDLEKRLKSMLTPNADGLLPCLWCGDKSPSLDHCVLGVSVICSDCAASGPLEKQIVKAIAAWNHRPLVRALVEAVKQRNTALDDIGGVRVVRQPVEDASILAILDGKEGT